jgi:hypothetical protein
MLDDIKTIDSIIAPGYISPSTLASTPGDGTQSITTYWWCYIQDVINLQIFEVVVAQKSPYLFLDVSSLENSFNFFDDEPSSNNFSTLLPTGVAATGIPAFNSVSIPVGGGFLIGGTAEIGTTTSFTIAINLARNSIVINYAALMADNTGITQAIQGGLNNLISNVIQNNTTLSSLEYLLQLFGINYNADLLRFTILADNAQALQNLVTALQTEASIYNPSLGLRLFLVPPTSNVFRIVSYASIPYQPGQELGGPKDFPINNLFTALNNQPQGVGLVNPYLPVDELTIIYNVQQDTTTYNPFLDQK